MLFASIQQLSRTVMSIEPDDFAIAMTLGHS